MLKKNNYKKKLMKNLGKIQGNGIKVLLKI